MPNEGHVKAEIIKARSKLVASQPKAVEPETPREPPVSPERMAQIYAENGINPASVGLKPFPKTGEGAA